MYTLFDMKAYDLLDFKDYDKVIISLSGGKDSTASLLHMIDSGVPRDKIEVWHQSVDGMNGTKEPFFDWPSTEGYVRKLAEHLGVKLGWQWRARGFKGELYRKDSPTGDVHYINEWESPTDHCLPSKKDKSGTRLRFPAKTANLSTRYCSASLKIDVARRVMNNRPDLVKTTEEPIKILWVTGERRQESPARAKYNEVEVHPSNSRARTVHWWRAVIDWKEEEIWQKMKDHGIIPHPAYQCGFPRLSCRSCIFFSKDHWATLDEVSPEVTEMLHSVEEDLHFTIDQKFSVPELIQMGKSRITDENRDYIPKLVSEWTDPVTTNDWKIPSGAFSGDGGGSI